MILCQQLVALCRIPRAAVFEPGSTECSPQTCYHYCCEQSSNRACGQNHQWVTLPQHNATVISILYCINNNTERVWSIGWKIWLPLLVHSAVYVGRCNSQNRIDAIRCGHIFNHRALAVLQDEWETKQLLLLAGVGSKLKLNEAENLLIVNMVDGHWSRLNVLLVYQKFPGEFPVCISNKKMQPFRQN